MQWVFLVLALLAALAELHTGTFYLAGVAAAALLTTLMGFWIRGDLLIFAFVVLCAILTAAVMLSRRHQERTKGLADFDIGQTVTIRDVPLQGNWGMSRSVLKFPRQASLIGQAMRPWRAVQGRGFWRAWPDGRPERPAGSVIACGP